VACVVVRAAVVGRVVDCWVVVGAVVVGAVVEASVVVGRAVVGRVVDACGSEIDGRVVTGVVPDGDAGRVIS